MITNIFIHRKYKIILEALHEVYNVHVCLCSGSAMQKSLLQSSFPADLELSKGTAICNIWWCFSLANSIEQRKYPHKSRIKNQTD